MAILIIAEQQNGVLRPATAVTVAAARAIGGEIHLLLAGPDLAPAAEAAATLDGVAKVLVAEGVAPLAEPLAALVAGLAGYGHILAPATTFGKNLAPRIAALLDVAQISDITAVVDPETFVRPIYAGSALATVRSSDPVKVVTVRPSAFDAVGAGSGATIERLSAAAAPALSRHLRSELSVSVRPELASARVVVSGGRGVGSVANFALVERLADALGAAVGASRAAVDSGFAPNDLQVGQTGTVVAPELYVAVGISGAIQHLAGMKDSKIIVAVNKDPEAPIFQVADYGLVADLFEALPELGAALQQP
jgi:electron transfer flavoprotein alpha subunit